jgi:hypothetical protein
MVLERNLFMAQEAVAHTRSKFTLGAQKKVKEVLRTFGESLISVAATRSIGRPEQLVTELKSLRAVAKMAEHVGCSTCEENAAIAFIHLLDQGVTPLDYMRGGNVEHTFVVIGRPQSSAAADPREWGANAVVCDPWHEDGAAYYASEFLTRMYKGEQMVPYTVWRVE